MTEAHSPLRIAFRVDASARLGSGHLTRCLALACALRNIGAECVFFLAEGPESMPQSFPIHRLSDATDPIPGDWDWLVLDHYALGPEWNASFRAHHPTTRLLTITDQDDRPRVTDLSLDFNYRGEAAGTPPLTQLRGPRYALLRPEFEAARQKSEEKTFRSPPRLLVFVGGGAPEAQKACLEALEHPDFQDWSIETVSNAAPVNMAEALARSDLYLGSGGTVTWERLCLGVPGVVVSVAENQVHASLKLAQDGYQLYLGPAEKADPESIRAALRKLHTDSAFREALVHRGRGLVDGQGARRVAREIVAAGLNVRPATPEDESRVLEWRNAEINRATSFNPKLITREEHHAWFGRMLSEPDRAILIGHLPSGHDVGVASFRIEAGVATISVYLRPGEHGHGYGPWLIDRACAWLSRAKPEVRQILAETLPTNARSIAAFTRAGFRDEVTHPRRLLVRP